MRNPLRRRKFGFRLLPVYLAAALVLWFAEPTPLGVACGGALVGAGAALRAWAAGHLVKTDRLTVSGPYAHLRHPLYAGTLLIAVGFGAIAGPVGLPVVAGAFLPAFFLYYLPYKDRIEAARLERRYGRRYTAYRDAVPRLWPSLSAWKPPDARAPGGELRFRRERFRDNGEAGTLLLLAALLLLLALRPALGLPALP